MPRRATELHRVLLQSFVFRSQHFKLTFCLKALSTVLSYLSATAFLQRHPWFKAFLCFAASLCNFSLLLRSSLRFQTMISNHTSPTLSMERIPMPHQCPPCWRLLIQVYSKLNPRLNFSYYQQDTSFFAPSAPLVANCNSASPLLVDYDSNFSSGSHFWLKGIHLVVHYDSTISSGSHFRLKDLVR